MSPCIRRFYGWKLSWIICLGNILLQGFGIYVMNALIEPLSAAYGWTRGGMGLALGVAVVCATISVPLLSGLAEKIGLRNTMLLGAITGGAATMLMGIASQLWLFTIFFSLVWIAGQACGGAIGNGLVSNWFLNYRGRAFGIVNVGTSFSGVVMPVMVLMLVEATGLRAALCITGGLIVLTMVPLILLFVRDSPEEMGLRPDGGTAVAPVNAQGAHAPFKTISIPLAHLFHSFKANQIGMAYGLGMMMSGGVVSQLKPRFTDLGFDDMTAMGLMAVCTLCAAFGKFGWGFLSDRAGALKAAKILFAWNSVGMALAFLPVSVGSMFIFSAIAGFGMGGFWTSFPTVVAYIYGREKFLSAYRYVAGYGLLRAFGYVIIGWSSQLTGSYGGAYLFFLAAAVAAFFCMCGLGEKDREEKPAFV